MQGIQASVARHLREKKYPHNIREDTIFQQSRDVVAAKCKSLKQQGKGLKKNRSDPFTEEEISIMFERGSLGNGYILVPIYIAIQYKA